VIDTSKPIKDVAHAYGVGPETLRNWLIKYREANGGTETEVALVIGTQYNDFDNH
jgi:transposase